MTRDVQISYDVREEAVLDQGMDSFLVELVPSPVSSLSCRGRSFGVSVDDDNDICSLCFASRILRPPGSTGAHGWSLARRRMRSIVGDAAEALIPYGASAGFEPAWWTRV